LTNPFLLGYAQFRFPTLNITISSTGWPTDGGPNASLANAQTYVNFAIRRALSSGGTPYRDNQVRNAK
jgi:exo-beta-1,3-glucanase (GH17 family)